jgi:hypothetical protein
MNIITRKEAKEQNLVYYFTGKPCLHGHIDKRQTINGCCAECNRIKSVKFYYKHNGKEKQRTEHKNKIKSNWRKKHKGKVNSWTAARYAAKTQRTPVWLTEDDLWLVQEVYELAVLRSKITNIEWHVDHVVPMQGNNVSGLHCLENLQVIPGHVNASKSNKWSWDKQQ